MPRMTVSVSTREAIEAAFQGVGDASYDYFKNGGRCVFTVYEVEKLEAAARWIREMLKAEASGGYEDA